MSKLSEAIDDTLTGQHRAGKHNLRYTDIKFQIDSSPSIYHYVDKQVRLAVQFRKDAWISETDWANTDIRSSIIRDVKRAMIEEVFGEFRPIILELRASLYDGDDNRTRSLLAQLENQMFCDGV